MAVESARSLRVSIDGASAFAEQGRITKGYLELLDGLAVARRSPQWDEELQVVLWYAAIEMYERRWFPEEWLPLGRR